MKVCGMDGANASFCLDSCNGYYGWMPDLDDFVYRYYMTGIVSDLVTIPTYPLPDTSYYPYTPLCLKGCYRGDTGKIRILSLTLVEYPPLPASPFHVCPTLLSPERTRS